MENMNKVKTSCFIIFLGLGATLVLSLFLVFAHNQGLPLLKSTGIGLLRFGAGEEDFFKNIYGFSDSGGFEAIGTVVRIIYLIFCATCIGTIFGTVTTIFAKPQQIKSERISKSLKFVFFQVYFGFAIVAIALICVAYPSTLFRYTYSTQYYFLLIPLAITLLTAIMIKKELNRPKIKTATKVCTKCGKEIMQDMTICGYCGERQGND